MDKHSQLLELAQKRKLSRWNGYKCIGDYHGGGFECDYVSPYTKSAHNVDSEIMVILQDWSSDEEMSDPRDPEAMKKYGYTPSLGTNIKLISLLKAHFGVKGLNDVYATNLFPFIKPWRLKCAYPSKRLSSCRSRVCLATSRDYLSKTCRMLRRSNVQRNSSCTRL